MAYGAQGGTNNMAPAAYDAVAFHPSLPAGKVAGRLLLTFEGVTFEADDPAVARVFLPLTGLDVRMGGAANRLIFFAHPAAAGWTIYTSNHAVLQDTCLRALQSLALQVNTIRGRRRTGRLIALGVLLAFLGAIGGLILAKDLLIKTAANRVPYGIEKQLGEALFERLRPTLNIAHGGEPERALNELAAPLARAAEDGRYDVKVYVQRSEEVNAFALPGGIIIFTTGLLLRAESYDEISGVLAHELAHVTSRHAMRKLIETIGLFALLQAALGDATGLAAVLATQGSELLSMKYSRDLEREADDKGFDYLIAAGVNPQGMLTFFDKLMKESEERGTAKIERYMTLMSTHPATQDRIDRMRRRLPEAVKLARAPKIGMAFEKFQKAVRESR